MEKRYALLLSFLITGLIASNIFLFSLTNNQEETVAISRVIDGDTLETQDGTTIRLENINTPEKNQYGYEQAKNFLKQYENQTVQIETTGKDKYGRTLAKIYTPQYLNLEIVEQGLATKFLVDSNEIKTFSQAETQAIENQRGLWQHSPYYNCFDFEINKQIITITNNCQTLNLKDWKLREEGRKEYILPEVQVGEINIYTTQGIDNQKDLFWDTNILNGKNTLYLLDTQNKLVHYEINY